MRRYICIRGCPDSSPMGAPLSHGWLRMWNGNIAELFDLVEAGWEVLIQE